MRLSLFLILVFLNTIAFAGTRMSAFHYLATTTTDNVYDITFTNNSISWKGLKGVDKDKSGTSAMKSVNIANAIEVLQWKTSLDFNTLIVDHEKLKFVSSGTNKQENWLATGTLKRIIE